MLDIYGRPNSQHTQKVLWACAELNLRFRFVHAGRVTTSELNTDYLRLNPNGLVPTLVEDAFVLWESNTIVRYLAARHGGELIPGDLRTRAQGERWMDWQATTLNDAFRPVFRPLVEGLPEARDPVALRPAVEKLNDTIAVLDRTSPTAPMSRDPVSRSAIFRSACTPIAFSRSTSRAVRCRRWKHGTAVCASGRPTGST
jgi:glutathione S-transferase